MEFNAPFLPPFVQSVEVGLEDLLGFVRVFGRRVNCDVVCIRLSLDSWGGLREVAHHDVKRAGLSTAPCGTPLERVRGSEN